MRLKLFMKSPTSPFLAAWITPKSMRDGIALSKVSSRLIGNRVNLLRRMRVARPFVRQVLRNANEHIGVHANGSYPPTFIIDLQAAPDDVSEMQFCERAPIND